MNSNHKSSVLQRFNHRELVLSALHECVFHMQFRLNLVDSNEFALYQLLWQALCGAVSQSKVTRLRGDYEWSARQPSTVRLPCRPMTRIPLQHGFLMAPFILQFHWVPCAIQVEPFDSQHAAEAYVRHVRHIPYVSNTDFYSASKVVALAACFCQTPCNGCQSMEWIPLELALPNILGFTTGLYTACLKACLVGTSRFNCIYARMTLLRHVKEITVFPRECFYMKAEDVPEDLLDLAYDLRVASLGMTPEVATFISWMIFSPVLEPRTLYDPPASFRSDVIRYENMDLF